MKMPDKQAIKLRVLDDLQKIGPESLFGKSTTKQLRGFANIEQKKIEAFERGTLYKGDTITSGQIQGIRDSLFSIQRELLLRKKREPSV